MNNLQQAAKQALEALEKCRDWPGAYDECSLALHDLRAALAEPEQKPIAWLLDDTHHVEFHQQCYHESPWWTPLYTAPTPQPEQPDTDCHLQGVCQRSGYSIAPTPRKPLTSEEISAILDDTLEGGSFFDVALAVARAIERAHGITGEQHE